MSALLRTTTIADKFLSNTRKDDQVRTMRFLIPFCVITLFAFTTDILAQEIVGVNVVPHQFSANMRWRRPPDPELGARVELFLLNNSQQEVSLLPGSIRFDEKSPATLLEKSEWAWHHSPDSWGGDPTELPANALTVVCFNGRGTSWGTATQHELNWTSADKAATLPFNIEVAKSWIAAISFHKALGTNNSLRMVAHLDNQSDSPISIRACRLWLPDSNATYQVLKPQPWRTDLARFPKDSVIIANSKGGFTLEFEQLPKSYAAIEVQVQVGDDAKAVESLWSYVRVRSIEFDISGGWTASDVHGRNSMTIEEYLKTLKRMHINTGQIEEVPGYTDNGELYAKYPTKRFNRMADLDRYGNESMLSTIHAVEFLGEPQYGGGRPVPPQEVYDKLMPYRASILPTTVTLSEERSWRYYAGLSDFAHYDAYRVIAPAADAWNNYDRWEGQRIRWGAPLETIGDMTRSLREQSRPSPIAYWSQGAHDGWGGMFSQRRSSPTPDELRAQAWQGLGNGIASLYWFNLSLKSLCKFPDLIEPITRVNREIRLLDQILLESNAYEYRRVSKDGKPDWDLSSLASPSTAVLIANDIAYEADHKTREFKFTTRPATLEFAVPAWIRPDATCYRIDGEGVHQVRFTRSPSSIQIEDEIHVVGVYICSNDESLKDQLQTRLARLIAIEDSVAFDPGKNEEDLKTLRSCLKAAAKN